MKFNYSIINRIWNNVKNIFFNPILLIVFFTIIGFAVFFLHKNDASKTEYLFSLIGLGISVAVVQCALIQNRIQKDNIKIQLFDKRYNIFQSVLDSITIINRNNWDRYVLFNEIDVSKQIFTIEENLYKSVHLSVCLFDRDLHSKLIEINNAFCKVAKSYKDILIDNMDNLKSQDDASDYISLLKSHILSKEGLNTKEYEEELKNKFPKTYISIMDFSKECDDYISCVNKSGIIKDFEKYIIVDSLDK